MPEALRRPRDEADAILGRAIGQGEALLVALDGVASQEEHQGWRLHGPACILELGFFVGRLGRGKVALLYREGVELPSDSSGVLSLPLDESGIWKTRLAGEMLDAGVSVDPSKVLRA